MNILKKTLKITFAVILAMIFVASIVVIIASVSQRDKGYSGAFGYTFDVVQTDSMEPVYYIDDVVIGKVVDADTTIDVGTIITFKTEEQGVKITKTHRVMEYWEEGTIGTVYKTQGDNADGPDTHIVMREDVVAVCTEDGKISGLGKVLNLMKQPIGYLMLAVPIGIYILYEIFCLISIFMTNKKQEMLSETEDAKDAIIREYLAKQQAEEAKAKAEANTAETPASEPKAETEQQNPVEEAEPAKAEDAESDKKEQ